MTKNELENHAVDSSALTEDIGQLVVFKLRNEEFGVDINRVKEIVRLPDITSIPRSPDYVAGVCNLRGNVLPVIETRIRFSMEPEERTESTRLLVVDSGLSIMGIIVDNVREVMRMNSSVIDPPPSVCQSIDKAFLDGVVKMDDGKRLILKLNLKAVINVEDVQYAKNTGQKIQEEQEIIEDIALEEKHLVSFKIAKEEYAFDIDKVREILRVTDITTVPNASPYVRGLFTVRNQLLPVLDLRVLLGVENYLSERLKKVDDMTLETKKWESVLKNAIESGTEFTGNKDIKKSSFEIWFKKFDTSSDIIQADTKKLQQLHIDLFEYINKFYEKQDFVSEQSQLFFKKSIAPLIENILKIFSDLKISLKTHISEDQRILVVETGSTNIGYLVDDVNEVIRIPKSVIDETPGIASSKQRELQGVAKLDKGERLIMIINENTLVTVEEQRELAGLAADSKKEGIIENKDDIQETLAQKNLEEEQLVTFEVGKEEYGISILEVQEINRLEEITTVPRSPYYIDGVTNLRGNVIPVINVRKLFDLDTKEVDDKTRIIIVDINDKKTGLRVDQVNEVLRLSKKDIDQTPAIISGDNGNNFIEGICKIKGGERMVILLNIKHILNQNELKQLSSMDGSSAKKQAKKKETKKVVEKSEVEKKKKIETKISTKKKKKKLEIAE